jgi:hypothetical protein
VAELTKISERYLSCIESGDYDQLPPGPYAKGYIAAYARQVCGDETQALELYAGSHAAGRRNNGGFEADPAAALFPADSTSGLDEVNALQPKKALWPKKLASGFRPTRALRNLLPDGGGNLRHLSRTGAAGKSALSAMLRSVSATLARLATRLGAIPKGVVLKGVLVSGGLLMAILILVLAGFGAYHLFFFKGGVPQTLRSEVSTQPPPEPEAAAPKKTTPPMAVRPVPDKANAQMASTAPQVATTAPQVATTAPQVATTAPQVAAAVPKNRSEDGHPGLKEPADTSAQTDVAASSVAEKATTAPAATPAANQNAVARKKPAPELKPKPSTPVVVQPSAEGSQAILSSTTAPLEDKAAGLPLTLKKASICTAIQDHMPVGVAEHFPWTTPRIFVWSLLGASDPPVKVHHRYYFEDELVSDVTLKVGSSYWRTWSFHTLSGQLHIGAWHVDITTEDGRVLRRLHFAIE